MRCSELLRASGTCFRRRLSAHHAGAAPPSAVAELGDVRPHSPFLKSMLSKLSFVALLLFSAISSMFAAEQSVVPKTFSAYIGGNNGPTYLIELHDGTLTYTSGPRGDPNHTKITPTAAQWREFRQTLDELDIWRWNPAYPNKPVEDGTQWQINLEYTDHALKAEGSNNFLKQFDRYPAAVQKVLGGKDFK